MPIAIQPLVVRSDSEFHILATAIVSESVAMQTGVPNFRICGSNEGFGKTSESGPDRLVGNS